jgi:Zn-dependent peptidase ImmA (M78 family)
MVLAPAEVPDLDPTVLQILLKEDPDSWSAVTVSVGNRDLIILNSSHTGGRPASDLMHELAHILTGHTPGRVDVSEDGLLMLNTYDKGQEAEAAWLAGALLLPREALLFLRKNGISTERALKIYGVSIDMLNYRLRMTGVDLQLRRARH